MGDIYHAGEVYAGSVPIDDTQASEDKVYSSAKVETMMDEKILASLVVEQKSDTSHPSIAAGAYKDFSFDITKQGYKPLGIVGIVIISPAPLSITQFQVISDTQAEMRIVNSAASGSTTLGDVRIKVLYVRK